MTKQLFLLALSVSLVGVAACASEHGAAGEYSDEPSPTVESAATSAVGCGARYTPALRNYELAVLAAKQVVARNVCNTVTNPKDGAQVEVSVEAVGELLTASIAKCPDFRRIYNESPFATPARTALSTSLLSEVVSGRLNTATFASIESALVGKKLFGPKPGVANLFFVTFKANHQLDYASWDPNTGQLIPNTDVSWSVRTVAGKKKIVIDIVDGTTLYTPRYRNGRVELVPDGGGAIISTSSDPCSA